MDYISRKTSQLELVEKPLDLGHEVARRFQLNKRKSKLGISRRHVSIVNTENLNPQETLQLTNDSLEDSEERRAFDPLADIIQLKLAI